MGTRIEIESTNRLLDYREFIKYGNTFIETGCAYADGVQRAIDAGFKKVISIEASEMYYESSFNRFIHNDNVDIVLGKSIDKLPLIIDVVGKEPYVIFLDAHVSGDTSAGYHDWLEKGAESDYAQDKTIKAELEIILSNYNKHVIIIDDVNGLKDGCAVQYCAQMLKANPDYKFYFYDENLSGEMLYQDKILVAIP